MSDVRGERAVTVTMAPPEVANGWAIHGAELREWARGDQPSIVYARAARLPKAIGDEARELHRLGIVNLVQRRIAGGFAFVAQRRGAARLRPVIRPRAEPEAPRVRELPESDELGRACLRILSRAANFNEPCPTDKELTRMLGLSRTDQASYVIRRLREAGVIETTQEAPDAPRIVTIVASGKRTSGAETTR